MPFITHVKNLLGLKSTATNAPIYDVVISYAGEDREYAQMLVTALQQQSIRVFYDKEAIDRLAAEPLPQKLRDIYENEGKYCVVLFSKHYVSKHWTMQELKAAITRLKRAKGYVFTIRLDDTKVPNELANIAYLTWGEDNAETITDVILKKLGRSYRWNEVSVTTGKDKNTAQFSDITWIGLEGWLTGATSIGGGYGSVGEGALLHTSDGGNSWHEVDKKIFPSGAGEFIWGPQGSREYRWNEIGPISSIAAYKRLGSSSSELWITSSTGVYCSADGGSSWQRSTPGPDDPKRYAFFANMANVEGFSEIYAVGWQGIAHWSKTTKKWDLQLPSYTYPISSICVLGGSENRNVWAVGRAGQDEEGNWGSDSHGAIYYLKPPQFVEWQQVDLHGIKFSKAQALSDILMLDLETVIAVGQYGMIIRGLRQKGVWVWTTQQSPTKADLNSVSYSADTVWAVGNDGVVVSSPDRGATWRLELVKEDDPGNKPVFRRVRFFGHQGWILGDGKIMKSVTLKKSI